MIFSKLFEWAASSLMNNEDFFTWCQYFTFSLINPHESFEKLRTLLHPYPPFPQQMSPTQAIHSVEILMPIIKNIYALDYQEDLLVNAFTRFAQESASIMFRYDDFSHIITLRIPILPEFEMPSNHFDSNNSFSCLIDHSTAFEALLTFFSKSKILLSDETREEVREITKIRTAKIKALLLVSIFISNQYKIREGKGLGETNLSFFLVESTFLEPEEAKDEMIFLPSFRSAIERYAKLLDHKKLLSNVAFLSMFYFFLSFFLLIF